MLVLTRNTAQSVVIGERGAIKLTVLSVKGNQVKIGIQAPHDIKVNRGEAAK